MDLREDVSIFLKHILEHSFDEIFIADAVGNILYTSQTTEKMFGIPFEPKMNQNISSKKMACFLPPSLRMY
ncbi:PAS domain-containing protein [Peribacillus simplex]|uniref:PAS domain-containing protein n=1 Tax=Peribacillus simplex TaxID=1478 RepID=UPI00382E3C60